jgi:hypothetical protein
MMNQKPIVLVRISQFLVGVVTFLNLQAAIYFLIKPEDYAPGFELSGIPGIAMVRGVGLLFLMWNIPYLVALVNPVKHFTSYLEAVAMQAIGVVGETTILLTLNGIHQGINASVTRFIIFDGGGFILLIVGLLLLIRYRKTIQLVK